MLGEIDYVNIFHSHKEEGATETHMLHYKYITLILFIIFIIVLSIIVLNLLIGLAASDVAAIRKESDIKVLRSQIQYALEVEYTLPVEFRKIWLKRTNSHGEVRIKKPEGFISWLNPFYNECEVYKLSLIHI